VTQIMIVILIKDFSIFKYLTQEDCIHAVGQGALAIECRQEDEEMLELVWALSHMETLLACISERAVLSTLVCHYYILVYHHTLLVIQRLFIVRKVVVLLLLLAMLS